MHEQGETNRFSTGFQAVANSRPAPLTAEFDKSKSESLASWEQLLNLMRHRPHRGGSLTHNNADQGSEAEAATVVA